jgi:hypothetical protein
VGHGPRIKRVGSTRDGLTQTAAIEFTRLPVAREESLLHLGVTIDDCFSKARINDLREFG